jgi:hypothetical protein
MYLYAYKGSSAFETIGAAFLAVIYLGLLAFAVWISDKGLNIFDEGFYLLQARYPDEVLASPTSYYHYSAFLFKLSGYNIVIFRRLGLFLMFVSSSIFYFGFMNLLKLIVPSFSHTRSFRINCWAFLGLGMMLYYSAFIQHRLTISYNMLNTVALYSALGLFFLGISSEKKTGERRLLSAMAFLLTGSFIGISFFVKFPGAILLLVLFSLVSVTGIIVRYGHAIMLILSGFILWLFIHFTIIQKPAVWWAIFSHNRVFKKHYAFNSLLTGYIHQFLDLLRISLGELYFSNMLLLFGFVLIYFSRKTKTTFESKKELLFLLVFTVAAVELSVKVSEPGAYGVNVVNLYASWLILLFSAAIYTAIYDWKVRKSVIKSWPILFPLCVFLFCAPFVAICGTVNLININLIMHLVPWFGLLLVFMIILLGSEKGKIVLPTGTLFIGLFVAAHILYGAVRPAAPYQTNGVLKLSEPTVIGSPMTSLKLDHKTSLFYKDMRLAAQENGFREGDDLLAFFDMPGLVFALGGKSPGFTWYFGNWYEGANDAIEYAMSLVSAERITRAFVLQSSGNQKLPDLEKFGITFPRGYVLCGSFFFPGTNNEIFLWKPQTLNNLAD